MRSQDEVTVGTHEHFMTSRLGIYTNIHETLFPGVPYRIPTILASVARGLVERFLNHEVLFGVGSWDVNMADFLPCWVGKVTAYRHDFLPGRALKY